MSPDSDQNTPGCCGGPAPEPEPPAAETECCGTTTAPVEETCGCGCDTGPPPPWQVGTVETLAGPVPRASTTLGWADRLGSWRVRWAIGRADYRVPPGLYAVGDAGPSSPVFVTANYKMSFDRLRAVLDGTDGWILVLDTKGINVWCAAGKGTFGTDELVRRIQAVNLGQVVNHRRLILPQLGATGVSAHRVEALSGWKVKFGPVRLDDIPTCVDKGLLRVKPEHRRVRFPFTERAILVPVELVLSARYVLGAAILILLLSGLGPGGYDVQRIGDAGLRGVVFLLAGWLGGGVLGPVLLPWLPGRAFSVKGALAGLALVAVCMLFGWPGPVANGLEAGGWLLLATAVASFLTMNFTGASTYTSLSGVRKEMRAAVPLQLGSAVLGIVLWAVGLFF